MIIQISSTVVYIRITGIFFFFPFIVSFNIDRFNIAAAVAVGRYFDVADERHAGFR